MHDQKLCKFLLSCDKLSLFYVKKSFFFISEKKLIYVRCFKNKSMHYSLNLIFIFSNVLLVHVMKKSIYRCHVLSWELKQWKVLICILYVSFKCKKAILLLNWFIYPENGRIFLLSQTNEFSKLFYLLQWRNSYYRFFYGPIL